MTIIAVRNWVLKLIIVVRTQVLKFIIVVRTQVLTAKMTTDLHMDILGGLDWDQKGPSSCQFAL